MQKWTEMGNGDIEMGINTMGNVDKYNTFLKSVL